MQAGTCCVKLEMVFKGFCYECLMQIGLHRIYNVVNNFIAFHESITRLFQADVQLIDYVV